MSALLSLNPIPLISWKGRTFNQVHSSIQKNGQYTENSSNSVENLFSANPLKIYRREVANITTEPCNSRASLRLDNFNRPSGTINISSATNNNGLVNTIIDPTSNNTCENYENCSVVLSPAENARNRVRSSGMIKRKFNENRNNDTYYTSTSQYLNSRNRTFIQNQYNYIRIGDSTATPGTNLASGNIYSPSGTNHCAKYSLPNTTFKYKWINTIPDGTTISMNDDTEYTVTIPNGNYSLTDINRVFKQTMFQNLHFLIKDPAGTTNEYYSENISYALNLAYNNNTNVIEINSYRIDIDTFQPVNYTIPTNSSGNKTWDLPSTGTGVNKFPQIIISNNEMKKALGFTDASYPSSQVNTNNEIVQTNTSSSTPSIQPLYTKLYYKPNNPQFAQQGAVSAGDLITRKKYNSITNSTAAYRDAFGNHVANALAYGVPSNGYTIKDKIGYPMKKTPTFNNYNSEMKECSVTSFANAI